MYVFVLYEQTCEVCDGKVYVLTHLSLIWGCLWRSYGDMSVSRGNGLLRTLNAYLFFSLSVTVIGLLKNNFNTYYYTCSLAKSKELASFQNPRPLEASFSLTGCVGGPGAPRMRTHARLSSTGLVTSWVLRSTMQALSFFCYFCAEGVAFCAEFRTQASRAYLLWLHCGEAGLSRPCCWLAY